jgi:uncharacterized membrane protein YphA (DoxX/SURF4 family)
MKILLLTARILMGLAFLVFGLNGFFHFIPMQAPPPTSAAGQYLAVMTATHYFIPIYSLQGICGILFIFNRFVPLALALICPVIVNILLFHALMEPSNVLPGLLVTICWIIVYYGHRSAFKGIFQQKA